MLILLSWICGRLMAWPATIGETLLLGSALCGDDDDDDDGKVVTCLSRKEGAEPMEELRDTNEGPDWRDCREGAETSLIVNVNYYVAVDLFFSYKYHKD